MLRPFAQGFAKLATSYPGFSQSYSSLQSERTWEEGCQLADSQNFLKVLIDSLNSGYPWVRASKYSEQLDHPEAESWISDLKYSLKELLFAWIFVYI